MKSYKLIHHLLTLVEQLEAENNGREIAIDDFAGYLLNHVSHSTQKHDNADIRFGQNDQYAQELAFQLDNNIGRLFIYMSRYAKSYIKKALDGTALQTAEEFTCLAILLTHDQLSKTELISHNQQEKTSGTEVIRRLLAAGLVEQFDNPNDKRSKNLSITSKGTTLLHEVFVDMGYVGKMITGKLSLADKLTLQHLLQKLEKFHYEHYQKKTITSKADLQLFVEAV